MPANVNSHYRAVLLILADNHHQIDKPFSQGAASELRNSGSI
jgi:hypothetical protein